MKRVAGIVATLFGLAIGGPGFATDDEADIELLEYLGSWEGDDDEWHEFFDSLPQELAEGAGDEETDDRSAKRDSD